MVQIIFLLDNTDLEQGSANYSPRTKYGLWPVSVWILAKNGFYIFKDTKTQKTNKPTKNIDRDHM